MTSNPTTSHYLYGTVTFDEGSSAIRALLFGHLADIAHDTVEHYRSDFFHDALWIEKHVEPSAFENGQFTFYFAFDNFGTAIGTDARFVAYGRRANVYQVTLRAELSEWAASEKGDGRATYHVDTTRLTDGEVAHLLDTGVIPEPEPADPYGDRYSALNRVWQCNRCQVFVDDRDLHDRFHAREDALAIPADPFGDLPGSGNLG